MRLVAPPPEDDSPELNYPSRPQLVQIDPGGQVPAVVGPAVPPEPRVARGPPRTAASVAPSGRHRGEIRPRHETPHPASAQLADRELHRRRHLANAPTA